MKRSHTSACVLAFMKQSNAWNCTKRKFIIGNFYLFSNTNQQKLFEVINQSHINIHKLMLTYCHFPLSKHKTSYSFKREEKLWLSLVWTSRTLMSHMGHKEGKPQLLWENWRFSLPHFDMVLSKLYLRWHWVEKINRKQHSS
jgi:hypothetical protein